MRLDFEGRHVVVTGGTGALGSSVLEVLAAAGAQCHVPTRGEARPDRLPAVPRARVRLVGGVDLGDDRSVAAFYEGLPGLWASIHCAGGFAMALIAETSSEDFDRMMDANGRSCFVCSREAVRRLRSAPAAGREGRGRIVNVAALPAVEPRRGAGMLAYAMSKSAVAALTLGLAEEVANEGIWVNAVVPSILGTDANRGAMPGADSVSWATTQEVAATIVFLASPQNAATRGALVPVFGRS